MLKNGYITDKGRSCFDEIVIYLGTLDAVDAFKKIPCENIIVLHEFDPDSFEQYLNDLKEHQMERLNKGKTLLNTAIVFDDFVGMALMKSVRGKSSPLERLMLTSRHECNMSVFFCSQTYKNNGFSTPTVRNNITHWLIYGMGRNEMEKIANEHCGDMTEDEFMDWYFDCMRKKHNFIMINYKKPVEERYTEKFTSIFRPKRLEQNSLLSIRDAPTEETTTPGSSENDAVRPAKEPEAGRKRKDKGTA